MKECRDRRVQMTLAAYQSGPRQSTIISRNCLGNIVALSTGQHLNAHAFLQSALSIHGVSHLCIRVGVLRNASLYCQVLFVELERTFGIGVM